MRNLEQFIKDYITHRSVSMFAADIETNKEKLTEEIKDYDRDAVRNIPALCDRIGMAIYERK